MPLGDSSSRRASPRSTRPNVRYSHRSREFADGEEARGEETNAAGRSESPRWPEPNGRATEPAAARPYREQGSATSHEQQPWEGTTCTRRGTKAVRARTSPAAAGRPGGRARGHGRKRPAERLPGRELLTTLGGIPHCQSGGTVVSAPGVRGCERIVEGEGQKDDARRPVSRASRPPSLAQLVEHELSRRLNDHQRPLLRAQDETVDGSGGG